MKRNLSLVKDIMLKLEADESLDNTAEVSYHLLLLEDAGYINLSVSHLNYMRELGTRYLPKIARLTWKGHDSLDRVRNTELANKYPVTYASGVIWDV